MNHRADIVVVGDVHGKFGKLTAWVNHRRPSIILQCGDFGYWPRHHSRRERKRGKPLVPKMRETRLYWCDGNHEVFSSLGVRSSDEVFPNVVHMPRGSTLKLSDGRTVLFAVVAESHDKEWRVEQEAAGGDKILFAEERITERDIADLPVGSVDWMGTVHGVNSLRAEARRRYEGAAVRGV